MDMDSFTLKLELGVCEDNLLLDDSIVLLSLKRRASEVICFTRGEFISR